MCIFVALMQEETSNTQGFNLKQVIVWALLFMMIGTSMELYLLGHYEDSKQFIPLTCIGISLLFMVILQFQRSGMMIKVFRLLMGLTALSGLYGVYLHLLANYEFEQEMKPTESAWNLFLESLSGALPALAPASMIVLALIGYSYSILLKQK
ncbi:MAG: hypothetical protein MRZ79_26785 [Bacteroidia bacterium]|nr:hypothetical protein [Bacteroidia bacterium]